MKIETKKGFAIWDLTMMHTNPPTENSETEYTLRFKADKLLSKEELQEALEVVKDLIIEFP